MKRLTLELTDEAYQVLETLKQNTHKSKANLLRTGLGLMNYAEEAKRNKKSIAVIKEDKIEKEIIIP